MISTSAITSPCRAGRKRTAVSEGHLRSAESCWGWKEFHTPQTLLSLMYRKLFFCSQLLRKIPKLLPADLGLVVTCFLNEHTEFWWVGYNGSSNTPCKLPEGLHDFFIALAHSGPHLMTVLGQQSRRTPRNDGRPRPRSFPFLFFLRLLPAVKNQESVCVVNSHVRLSPNLPAMLSLKALKNPSLTFSH